MTNDEQLVYEGLDTLTKRQVVKEDFQRLYSDQLLEGIISKNYAFVREDNVVQITVQGVKRLLALDTHAKSMRY